MYGDFSRLTYSRDKRYTAVWSQQGRVQLDADANEQTAILLDWLRTLAHDFIGPFGGHVVRAGFRVGLKDGELTFSRGHYYVYGLRCENPEPASRGAAAVTYRDLAGAAEASLPKPPYLVELLVWERSVSAVTDPGLLEPALGPYPPDTTVRSQLAWMPRLSQALPGPEGRALHSVPARDLSAEHISRAFDEYNSGGRKRPELAARVDREAGTDEATIVPATSGYLGVENQLYRVEVHIGSSADGSADGSPTFKWSRDNGSAEFRIVAVAESERADDRRKDADELITVTVFSLGRDDRTRLEVGDWVELVDDASVPLGPPPPLLQVHAIERAGLTVTLSGKLPRADLALHPYLRRWDQGADSQAGPDGIPVVESSGSGGGNIWLDLEDGVQVRFAARGADYQTGDYWLIPARTATGGLLWPGGAHPEAIGPYGPDRYLVPLALVRETGKEPEDMRTLFTHLAWPEPDRPDDSKSG